MIDPCLDFAVFAREHRVRFVRKDRSRLMRAIGWLLLMLFGYRRFMSHAWTTIGRTVYYPVGGPEIVLLGTDFHSGGSRMFLNANRSVVEHELYHVLQYERLWHLHSLLYLVFPLPVGLAWYRWRCERVAYLHQILHHCRRPSMERAVDPERYDGCQRLLREIQAERAVNALWRVYGWCWPKAWMRAWFLRRLGK